MTGINIKKRESLIYQSFPSTIRPVAHSDNISIPEFKELPDLFSDGESYNHKEQTDCDDDGDEDFACFSTPVLIDQHNLSDFIRGLNLFNESSEVLASRLKDQNLLQHDTKIIFYRSRNKEFVPFFDDELNLIFCKDIPAVLMEVGVTEYPPANWRLLIDSSKRRLECVLLHITNVYVSTPITTLKEKFDAIKSALQYIKYNDC